MKTKIILLALISAAAFSSCSKDKYQPKGDYITTGTNNNTVKTYAFTVTGTQWSSSNSIVYYYDYANTDSRDGSITAFFSTDNTNWTALPYNDFFYKKQWSFGYDSNTISVWVENTDATISAAPATTFFKIVIVPPGS